MSEVDNKNIIVISGIDTGIGKSVATGLLARWIKESGSSVITMKMVQTGNSRISEDIIEHRKLTGVALLEEDAMGLTCPYIFSVPCSPHLAARLDGRYVDPVVITDSASKLAQSYDYVLVEGVGGLFVPLNDETSVIDLIAANNWRTILVTGPRLGSINHTLAALECLENRRILLQGLIYNLEGSLETDPRIVDDSRRVFEERIGTMAGGPKLCDIPSVGCTESYCVDFSILFK
jgi:dethiobiotin synthetase